MKFMISSLFLAFLVVAANAASLEKGEKIDELSGPTAHEHEHEHALKTAPAEVVEAKSGEISGAEVPVGHLKSVDSEKSEQSERLPITILYEALCPDSRALIAELGREYFDFGKYIKLNFVPFGRAKSVDAEGKEFQCHHGPNECIANRVQSCALEQLKGQQDAQEKFVVCQMRKDSEPTGQECAEQAGCNWSQVKECADGEQGRKLQLAAEAETKAARDPLKNVPTVIFNGQFNDGLQEKAVKGLRPTFCELLAEQKLETCAAKV